MVFNSLLQNVDVSQGMPGVSGPLVDDEGFPRGDIDLYAVRQARNKYVCAQTDHMEVMKKIEQAG